MTIIRFLQKLLIFINKNGFKTTLMASKEYLRWQLYHYKDGKFDRRFGTETSKIEFEYLQDIQAINQSDIHKYEAITWEVFSRMMDSIPAKDMQNYTFIDFGAGKGRALMLASLYQFKHIIGVELSPHIYNIAKNNIKVFLEKTNTDKTIKLHNIEASSFSIPDGDMIIFLYNPFSGTVLENFLDMIEIYSRSLKNNAYILYRTPICANLFVQRDFIHPILMYEAFHIYKINNTTPAQMITKQR